MLPPGTDTGKKGEIGLPARLLATWFGIGYAPVAPGTFGTLATIPLAWWLGRQGLPIYLGATALLIGAGIWAADAMVRGLKREDPQVVVIDEVAGYLLTVAVVPHDALHLALGFVIFRVLDIWKPGAIGWLDRNVKGGLGVMSDDLLAGVVGGAALWAADAGLLRVVDAW